MTLNIADLFEAVADAIPDRVPLILEDVRLSYAELELRSNRLAHHLQSVGVEPGQHVGIHMRNCVEYVEALLACLKIRAVPINVNFRYTDAELLYIYTNSQMVALLVEEGIRADGIGRGSAVSGDHPRADRRRRLRERPCRAD